MTNIKKSIVITPPYVANNIYKNVKKFPFKNILDIGCWDGSLSKPWTKKHNSKIIGLDITEEFKNNFDIFLLKDFLKTTQNDFKGLNIDFVVCNPPFGKHKTESDLYPFLFLKKIFDLFGNIPCVMIVGHWFLSNSSERIKYLNNINLTRNTTLHKRTFDACGVSVESNILYFNIKQKIKLDFLDYEKPKQTKQRFKTVAFSDKQMIFIKDNIENFSGEVKELLKEKYKNFP